MRMEFVIKHWVQAVPQSRIEAHLEHQATSAPWNDGVEQLSAHDLQKDVSLLDLGQSCIIMHTFRTLYINKSIT